MNEVKFLVYRYTFEDGKVYIGRTRDDQKRLGNMEKYKDQYVYKIMCKQKFTVEVLFESDNPFLAYNVEEILINHYYEHSYNAALEEGWLQTVFKDISRKTLNYSLDDLQRHIEDYKDEISWIREDILRQAEIGESKN